jgi:hypothetical protein
VSGLPTTFLRRSGPLNTPSDALYEMLGEELKHRTTDEWLDLLQQNGRSW